MTPLSFFASCIIRRNRRAAARSASSSFSFVVIGTLTAAVCNKFWAASEARMLSFKKLAVSDTPQHQTHRLLWKGWSGNVFCGGGIHTLFPSRIFDTFFILIRPCWSIAICSCSIGRSPAVPSLQISCALRYRCCLNRSRTIDVALLVHGTMLRFGSRCRCVEPLPIRQHYRTELLNILVPLPPKTSNSTFRPSNNNYQRSVAHGASIISL